MADAGPSNAASKTALRSALWLALFVLIAFGLRSVFSAQTSFDAASDRNLFTGNDPYYHFRTVTHVVQTGQSLIKDTAINYPEGVINPNPPLWTWTTAPIAVLFGHMGIADPVGTALNVMVAVWGALTVIPVWMIANDIWGRKTAFWSAGFIAFSAPAIQRSIWGYADHDAISMFFVMLAFAFVVKAFKAIKAERFVAKWNKGADVAKGLRAAVTANRNSLVYAALAGIALTACAVTWKGYPYAVAILAVAAGLQLTVDHFRNKDALATFLVYLTVVAVTWLLPDVLYYHNFSYYESNTVVPCFYVLLGLLAAGLVLVPTRDLPSVLVFPTLIGAGLLGLALLLLVFPAVGAKLFSGLGYFDQTKLYSTIAEAQRPSLGEVAANFGFFTFLLGFWGFGHALRKAWKGDAPNLFLASASGVALFMSFAASRFIVNAAPLFAILVGYALTRIIAMVGLDDVRRKFASQHGQGAIGRSVRSVSGKAVAGVLLVAAFLILPNVWTGVDASMTQEYKVQNGLIVNPSAANPSPANHFGAFGIDQELAKGSSQHGWLDVMETLSKQDTSTTPMENRPAFIGWWDYGHWAVGIGDHPTVADPFQSHYELSGRFLASDSEEEANTWLLIDLLNGDAQIHDGGHTHSPAVQSVLQAQAPGLIGMPLGYGSYDAAYKSAHGNVTGDKVTQVLDAVGDAMGKHVGYLGVDRRMFPYDDPNTAYVDNPSIFYAPVFLANKNPDDYMITQFKSGSTTLTVSRYQTTPDGGSIARPAATYTDQAGNPWVVYNGYAYRDGQTPVQGYSTQTGIPLSQTPESMVVTTKFDATMFGKAFGGISTQSPAGNGLAHWRLLDQSVQGTSQPGISIRNVALLAYYTGVKVSGTLRDSNGVPLAGYGVAFQDGNGARHGTATTAADGSFTTTAPFAVNNDLSLVVVTGGNVIFRDNSTAYQFTEQQARSGGALGGVNIVLQPAALTGRVFEDRNNDGSFGTNDTALPHATVTVGSASTTTDDTGRYSLPLLTPGLATIQVRLAGYQNGTAQEILVSGQTTTHDVALTVKPSAVTLTVVDKDGATPIGSAPITIQGPSGTSAVTDATGKATVSLLSGSYTFTVDANLTVGGKDQQVTAHGSLFVPPGGDPLQLTLKRE